MMDDKETQKGKADEQRNSPKHKRNEIDFER